MQTTNLRIPHSSGTAPAVRRGSRLIAKTATLEPSTKVLEIPFCCSTILHTLCWVRPNVHEDDPTGWPCLSALSLAQLTGGRSSNSTADAASKTALVAAELQQQRP